MRAARLRALLTVLLLAVGGLALASPGLAAAPRFPALTGRVVDEAQLLPAQTEAALTQKLAAFEQQTGNQLVVATLPSLQGYEIEEFGYQLGRAWGIGQKDRDTGVLLLVAPNERRVRIEVGYGLEPVLTDALSSLIVQQAILPALRQGDYARGIDAGVDAIIAQLKLPPEEAQARAAAARAEGARSRDSGGGSWWILFWVIIVFFFLLRRAGGRRYRRRGFGAPVILWGPGLGGGWGGGSGGGFGGGGFGGGGFGGGGGSFGGGGSSGSW